MSTTVFNLGSKLTFGKHKGETIQWVIDNDPSYIRWAEEEIEWFRLDENAQEALAEALPEEDNPWPPEHPVFGGEPPY